MALYDEIKKRVLEVQDKTTFKKKTSKSYEEIRNSTLSQIKEKNGGELPREWPTTSVKASTTANTAQKKTVNLLDVAQSLFGDTRSVSSDPLTTSRNRTEFLLESYGGVQEGNTPSRAAQALGTPNARQTPINDLLKESLGDDSYSVSDQQSIFDEINRLGLQRAQEIELSGRDNYSNAELDRRISELQSQYDNINRAYNDAAATYESVTGNRINQPLLEQASRLETLQNDAFSDPQFVSTTAKGRLSDQNNRVSFTSAQYGMEDKNNIFAQMDSVQQNVYDYYIGKGDTQSAAEYLNLIRDELNYRVAEEFNQTRSEWGDLDPRNLFASFTSGASGAFSGTEQAIRRVLGEDNATATPYLSYSQGLMSEEWDSGIGKIVNDLANTSGYMLPSTLVGGTAGNVLLGTSAGGNAYNEAIKEGQDPTLATGYAVLSGLTESATQALFGGISRLGNKLNITGKLSSSVQSAVRKLIKNEAGRSIMATLTGYLTNAAGEGAEEFIQEYIDAALNIAFFGKQYNGNELLSDALYSALLGSLNAAVLNVPSLPSDYASNRMNETFEKYWEEAQTEAQNVQNTEQEQEELTIGEAQSIVQQQRQRTPLEAQQTLFQAATQLAQQEVGRQQEEKAQAIETITRAAQSGLSYEQATSSALAQNRLTSQERIDAYANGMQETVAGINMRTSENAIEKAARAQLSASGQQVTKQNLKDAVSFARSQIRLLDELGKTYGVKIILQDSISANGKQSAANASFDPATGEIRVATDAVAQAYAYVGTHELVHYVKEYNDGGYLVLEDTVMDALKESGADVEKLIQYEINRIPASTRNSMTDDAITAYAREEVVANAVPGILTQENVVRRIVENNRTLATRIADFFKNLAAKLRNLLDKLTKEQRNFSSAQEIAKTEKVAQEVADTFFGALQDVKNKAESKIQSVQQEERFSLRDPQNLIEQYETDPEAMQQQIDELNDTVRAQQTDIQSYDRTVRALKNTVDSLRGEFKVTNGQTANRKLTQREANRILREWGSNYDAAQLGEEIASSFESLLQLSKSGMTDEQISSTMNAELHRIASGIIEQASERDTTVYDDTAELRAALKSYKISFNDGQLAEIRQKFGSLNTFRKALMGKVSLSQQNGSSIDGIWQELSALDSTLFDPETREGDMPERLYDVANYIYDRPIVNPYGYDTKGAENDLTLELWNAVLNTTPRETFADRQKKKLTDARAKITDLKKQLRAQSFENAKALREQQRSAAAEQRKALSSQYKELKAQEKTTLSQAQRQAAQEKKAALREQYAALSNEKKQALTAQRTRIRDRQQVERYRKSIEKNATDLYTWVTRPTKEKHVPESLKSAVANLVQSLDFAGKNPDSARALKWRARMNDLKVVLERSSRDESGAFLPDLNPALLTEIDTFLSQNGTVQQVMMLDSAQLKKLNEIIARVKHEVTTANQLFNNQMSQHTAEVAQGSISELDAKKEAKYSNAVRNTLKFHMLDAPTFFHQLGKAAESIYTELREGFDQKTFDLLQSRMFMEALKKKYGKELTKDADKVHEIKLGENTVSLTTGELMKLYTLSRRPQALPHLFEGGFRPQEKKGDKNRQTRPIRLNPETLAILLNELTPKQKQAAEEIQKFQSTVMAEWGNEASMKRYGYRAFNEEFYSSINSDRNFLTSSGGEVDERGNLNASYYALANLGMTKPTTPNARNPVIVQDIFEDFFRHADQMSSYHAYLVPLADAMRWLNYKSTDSGEYESVKQSLNAAFGAQAEQYISRFVKRLNGMTNTKGGALDFLLRSAKVASVAGNIRVAIQQPSAYFRAFSVLDWKRSATLPLAVAQSAKYAKLARQYSPIALWKSWGFYDTNVGPSLRSVVLDSETVLEKIQGASTVLAEKADAMTWGWLFRACVSQVKSERKDLAGDTEAIYQEAGKLLSKVVDQTQVVDSAFTRAPILDQSGITKLYSAFKSEPFKSYNMLYRAWTDVQNAEKGSKAKFARQFAKTSVSWITSSVATIALASVVDAFLRGGNEDDEDLTALQKYLDAVLGNWTDLLPTNLFPLLSDMTSMLTDGYGASRLDAKGWESVVNLTKEIEKLFNGTSKKSAYGLFDMAATAFSYMTGIPVSSVMRDFVEPVVKIFDPKGKALSTEKITASSTNAYDELYSALMSGETEKAQSIKNELMKGSAILGAKDTAEIDAQLGKRLAESLDPHVVAAFMARQKGDTVTLKKEYAALTNLGFSTDAVTRAVNRIEDVYKSAENLPSALFAPKEEGTSKPPAMYDAENLFTAIRGGNEQNIAEIYQYLVDRSDAEDPAQSVKNAITAEFKDEYVDLYLSEDYSGASRLRETLTNIGAGYTMEDFDDWVLDELNTQLKDALYSGDTGTANRLMYQQYDLGRSQSGMKSSITSASKTKVGQLFDADDFYGIEKTFEYINQLDLNGDGSAYYDLDKVVSWVESHVEDEAVKLAQTGDYEGIATLISRLENFDAWFGIDRRTSAYDLVYGYVDAYLDERASLAWVR